MPGSRAAAAAASRHLKSEKPQAKRLVRRDRPAEAKPAPARQRSSSAGKRTAATGKSSSGDGSSRKKSPVATTKKTAQSYSEKEATTWELCSFLVLRGLSSLCFAVPHFLAQRTIFNDPFAR